MYTGHDGHQPHVCLVTFDLETDAASVVQVELGLDPSALEWWHNLSAANNITLVMIKADFGGAEVTFKASCAPVRNYYSLLA